MIKIVIINMIMWHQWL